MRLQKYKVVNIFQMYKNIIYIGLYQPILSKIIDNCIYIETIFLQSIMKFENI